jgi:two-component system, LuxR family, response regulator FixJ
MTETKPKVSIVDDDESVRRSLMMVCKAEGLEAQPFSSAFQFLSEYNPTQRGCLLLDIRMPDMDGISLQKYLLQKKMHIPIIIISGHANIPLTVEAVKLGAISVIEKPFGNYEIIKLIREAFAWDLQFREEQTSLTRTREGFDSLSNREREVLQCIRQGLTNKVVAHKLGLSHKTIEYHRKNIMTKMHADSVVELIQSLASFPLS